MEWQKDGRLAGGSYLYLNFELQERRLYAYLSDQGAEGVECQGDNRDPDTRGN